MTRSSHRQPGVAVPDLLDPVLRLRGMAQIRLLVRIATLWLPATPQRGDAVVAEALVSAEADPIKRSRNQSREAKAGAERRHWNTHKHIHLVVLIC